MLEARGFKPKSPIKPIAGLRPATLLVVGLINKTAVGLHFVTTGKIEPNVAVLLKRAYDSRQTSDYESDVTEDKTMAKSAMENAQTFIAAVRIILSKES